MRKKSFCGRHTDEYLRGEVDDDEDTAMKKIISQKRQIIMYNAVKKKIISQKRQIFMYNTVKKKIISQKRQIIMYNSV